MIVLILVSGYGRKPVPWVAALAVWLSIVAAELDRWRASRRSGHVA
jgi:hypothetical protein